MWMDSIDDMEHCVDTFFNQLHGGCYRGSKFTSGVARAFPGGRVAHPEGQNEEENAKNLRKNRKNLSKFEEVELLPTRDCEAGYGLEVHPPSK